MNLFDAFDKLITEHGSATVMRERLELIREQMQSLEKKVVNLETENARLVKRVGELESQASSAARADEFVEHRGALFKRKPSGGYHLAVYCPDCKRSVGSHHVLPYSCYCGWSADFNRFALDNIMKELP